MFKVVRRGRRRRAAFALSIGCLALTIPGLASAGTAGLDAPQVSVPDTVETTLERGPTASPPPLDTVEETVGSVLDPVDDATKPVKDAVKPVTDPVDETVDPVTDTIDKGTTPVTDVVDEPGKQVIDGTGGRATNPSPVSPSQDPVPGREVTGRRPSVGEAGSRLPSRPRAPHVVGLEAAARPSASAVGSTGSSNILTAPSGSITQQIARAAADASRAFRFPLLVAAAVLMFLAIQGRIDSNDPKLAHANDDELMFA